MVKINQIFKVHWLTIILSFGLILMTIVLINKNKEINRLAYEISDFEDKVSTLENEEEELESELEDCKSEKFDFESISNNQSYDNSSLLCNPVKLTTQSGLN